MPRDNSKRRVREFRKRESPAGRAARNRKQRLYNRKIQTDVTPASITKLKHKRALTAARNRKYRARKKASDLVSRTQRSAVVHARQHAPTSTARAPASHEFADSMPPSTRSRTSTRLVPARQRSRSRSRSPAESREDSSVSVVGLQAGSALSIDTAPTRETIAVSDDARGPRGDATSPGVPMTPRAASVPRASLQAPRGPRASRRVPVAQRRAAPASPPPSEVRANAERTVLDVDGTPLMYIDPILESWGIRAWAFESSSDDEQANC